MSKNICAEKYQICRESVPTKKNTISICWGHSTQNLMTHIMKLKSRSMVQFNWYFSHSILAMVHYSLSHNVFLFLFFSRSFQSQQRDKMLKWRWIFNWILFVHKLMITHHKCKIILTKWYICIYFIRQTFYHFHCNARIK